MKNRHFNLYLQIFSFLLFISLFTSQNSQAQWVQTGGPEGGQINSIVSVKDKLFIATYCGIFVSSDNGLNWQPKNNGLEYLEVNELFALDDIIFAANLFGIYRSTDNGESWSLSYNNYTSSFASNGTNVFATLGYDGIIMTTDKGDTWNNIGLEYVLVNVLTVYGNTLYAGTDDGVYITTNNGNNWTQSYVGLPSLSYIMALSVKGNTLIASVASEGVFRSTDNGNNWTFSGNGLPDFYIQSFFIKENLIYAGTNSGVYVSWDNGANWQYSSSGIDYSTVIDIYFHNNIFFAGTSNGIYFSNTGENWSIRSSGLKIIDINSLAKHDSYIFAGYYNGVYKSQDNGKSWTNIDFIYGVTDLISIGQYLNAITYVYNGFYRTSDGGIEWDYVKIDSNNLIVYFISGKDNYLFASTTQGLYRSDNNGQTWTVMEIGAKDLIVYSFLTYGNNILISTSNNSQNYGKVLKSSDNGNNWTIINTNPPNTAFKLIGGKDEIIYASRGEKLYTFNTINENWAQISTLIGSINKIIITPSFFIAATNAGISISTDNGVNWINKNEGFNNPTILGNNSAALLIDNDNVYTSQEDESVWIRPLNDLIENIPISVIPSDYELKQNYPNPFNPATTIEFNLPIAGNVKLYVYDVSGREIASLLNQDLSVGNYKVSWTPTGVSSGIYFYKLVTKHFTQTKKMMLVK